jgi:hypothetical protein
MAWNSVLTIRAGGVNSAIVSAAVESVRMFSLQSDIGVVQAGG